MRLWPALVKIFGADVAGVIWGFLHADVCLHDELIVCLTANTYRIYESMKSETLPDETSDSDKESGVDDMAELDPAPIQRPTFYKYYIVLGDADNVYGDHEWLLAKERGEKFYYSGMMSYSHFRWLQKLCVELTHPDISSSFSDSDTEEVQYASNLILYEI